MSCYCQGDITEEMIMIPEELWLEQTIRANRTRRQIPPEWTPAGERRRWTRRSARRRIDER